MKCSRGFKFMRAGIYRKDFRPEYPWVEQYTVRKVMKKTADVSNFVEFDDGEFSEDKGTGSRYPLSLLEQQLSDGFTFTPFESREIGEIS